MTSNRESFEALAEALEIFLDWKAAGRPGDTETLLVQHEDKRELLEHLLEEDVEEDAAGVPADRVLGDFRIVREIGRGGMGVVFEAEQLSLKRTVALKVLPPHVTLHPASAARLQQEARLVASLKHPGIVQVFACGSERDEHYLAMELVEGQPLDAMLHASGGKLDPRAAARLAVQVADALHHAHQRHIVHRDVKPSNILIREDGATAVLTDFGIARDQGLPSLTMTGDFMGTPYYVSPEQVSARRVVLDYRTDVYSLGATLYEMVTGHKVFEGDTTAEILTQILTREPRPVHKVDASLPADLSAIIGMALEKNPDKRYLTAEAFADDLRRYLEGRPVQARHITAAQRLWRWAAREPALASAITAVFVTLLVGITVSTILYSDAEASLADYTRLASGVLLEKYEREFRDELWPARAETAPAMRSWIRNVEEITVHFPLYHAKLDALRERALPYAVADIARDRASHPSADELGEKMRIRGIYESASVDPEVPKERRELAARLLVDIESEIAALTTEVEARRTFRFEDHEDQFLHDTLAAVVSRLERFANAADGLLPSMRKRLEWALSIETESIAKHDAEWKRARAAIRASPKYGGLDLPPQLGLVPLGPDPKSGLWEFGHLRTGALAIRDPDTGELRTGAGTGIVFVLIPAVSTWIGSQNEDRNGPNHDGDAHPTRDGALQRVDTAAFLLAKHEMTQGQWTRFTGINPSGYRPHEFFTVAGRVMTLAHPVEQVSHADCRHTLRRMGLRLPRSVEWEVACRAGTQSVFHSGDAVRSLQDVANVRDAGSRADFEAGTPYTPGIDDGYSSHAPVGTYGPNAFGLYDMHGNVAEWVEERAKPEVSATEDDRGNREIRGGSHVSVAAHCRSAARFRVQGTSRVVSLGCRPARAIDPAR